MKRGFKVDMTQHSGVVVCLLCGWRGMALGGDRVSAWRQAASHERRAHPGADLASSALAHAARRHGG